MSLFLALTNKASAIYNYTAGRYDAHDLVLCYHSVRDKNRATRGWLSQSRSVDSVDFENQIQWLSSVADIVTLEEIMTSPRTGKNVRVAITFDDGHFDNVDVALPILRRYDAPVTWFVATEFIDNAHLLPWWDLIDLVLAKCSEPMELSIDGVTHRYDPSITAHRNWLNTRLRIILKSSTLDKRNAIHEDLMCQVSRQLEMPVNSYARHDEIQSAVALGGITLGGHTASHPNVALCNSDELTREIARGKSRLEEITGAPLRWFAYPFGGKGAFSPSAAEIVKQSGFSGACTLLPGTVSKKTDRFMIPRFAISPLMSMETFKARVLGAPIYAGLNALRSKIVTTRKYGKGNVR